MTTTIAKKIFLRPLTTTTAITMTMTRAATALVHRPEDNDDATTTPSVLVRVACNVYVSSASSTTKQQLIHLLSETQRHCRQVSTTQLDGPTTSSLQERKASKKDDREGEKVTPQGEKNPPSFAVENDSRLREGDIASVAVVHAFADTNYDRSSFHLAGGPSAIVPVAVRLALQAHQVLLPLDSTSNNSPETTHPHPSVGIVDHISVMPLLVEPSVSSMAANGNSFDAQMDSTAAASEAAIEIGRQLEQQLSQQMGLRPRILYYGGAHSRGTCLADVRRHRTSFFQSTSTAPNHSTNTDSDNTTTDTTKTTVMVVGAPERFVENWNVRLSNCPRSIATKLTQRVRGLGGGGRTVEALTLPYSHGQWEVACNLLDPTRVSAWHVDRCAREWLTEWESDASSVPGTGPTLVASYRVGTTTDQCWRALHAVADSNRERTRHDDRVMEQFRSFLDPT